MLLTYSYYAFDYAEMRKFNPIGTKNQYIYFAINPKSRTFATVMRLLLAQSPQQRHGVS